MDNATMTEAVVTKRTARINTIRRTANKARPELPGNLLINDKWFSNREFRNNLIGAGLPTEIALPTFQGCVISYKELTITEELLAQHGGSYTHKVNGRDVVYKRPGVVNIEMVIDFTTLNVNDSLLNVNKLVHMFGTGRPAPRAPQSSPTTNTPPAQQAETIEEPVQEAAPVVPTTTPAVEEAVAIEEEEELTEPQPQ